MQRQPHDVALISEALDSIHELTHQKEPTALFPGEILFGGAVDGALVQIEAWSFVDYLEDEIFVADDGTDADMFAAGRFVAAQDGVRQRFRERHRNVELALVG